MEPRQQLIEQTVVALQEKLKVYEERQDRLLTSINQVISELIEKAAKQRGVRGTDTLALHHFFATHLASAIETLQGVVDERLRKIPIHSIPTVSDTSSDVETRLALIETKLVQQVQVSPQLGELESKFKQLEMNTVQELRRIHQTTFKPGDYGTPLYQLQQKLDIVESQLKSITSVDAVKLAESTMSSAIRSFRNEFETVLQKFVSAEDLMLFRTEINRLEALIIDVQTRTHTILEKSASIYDKLHTRYNSSLHILREEFLGFQKKYVEELYQKYVEGAHTKIFNDMIQKVIDVEHKNTVLEKQAQEYQEKILSIESAMATFGHSVEQTIAEQTAEIRSLRTKLINNETKMKIIVDEIKQNYVEKSQMIQISKPIRHTIQQNSKGSIYQSLTKCFYTAIFVKDDGQRDTLEPFVPIPGWDAVCFTNVDLPNVLGWTIVRVDMPFQNTSLSSKYYKWLSHLFLEDYDVVVWTDAYLVPDSTKMNLVQEWITQMYLQNKTIGHHVHAERNCIYDECDAVVKGKRDTPANVDKVRNLLRKSNMPKQKGLFDSNIVIKFHKDLAVQAICKDIFNQLKDYSNRDQLAITYQYYIHKFTQLAIFPLMEAWQKRGIHVRVPAF